MSNFFGKPESIQSDCAGELIAGKNVIQGLFEELNSAKTHKCLAQMNIKWYHSTPRSPMKNSLVEVIVKLTKNVSKIFGTFEIY